jgi:hypothetical protein
MPDEAQTTIAADDAVLTLITTFTCADERQDALVTALTKTNDEVLTRMDGFVAAAVHASLDRTHVINYVQWRTVEDFDRAQLDPDMRRHLEEIMAMAETADPRLYHVKSVHRG